MSLEEIEFNVEIKTPIYPTEDIDRIIICLKNLFPDLDWEVGPDKRISAKGDFLQTFKEILKAMKIRDTARNQLKNSITTDRCSFSLSKQASCNQKISFAQEEQPLGAIDVVIKSDKITELIEELTKIEGE